MALMRIRAEVAFCVCVCVSYTHINMCVEPKDTYVSIMYTLFCQFIFTGQLTTENCLCTRYVQTLSLAMTL